jgi:hypothetical protein
VSGQAHAAPLSGCGGPLDDDGVDAGDNRRPTWTALCVTGDGPREACPLVFEVERIRTTRLVRWRACTVNQRSGPTHEVNMRSILPLLLLSLCACFERQYDCDDMAALSVEVTVESSDGEPMQDLEVRYTGPGDAEPRPCEDSGSTWLCGWEVAGEILIEASATCHGAVSETVVVSENECHVEQQDLQLMLDPVDCTQEELPGVYVTVHDEDGDAIPDAAVGFVPADQDWTDYEPCEAYNDGWGCAWGYSGDIDLEVTATGFSPWTGQVTVLEDCCGPVTETVDVVMVLGG